MTDKLYNGFNNGRDKSDGVGGREVNHGTQETMTKEQILYKNCVNYTGNEKELTFEEFLKELEHPDTVPFIISMEEYKNQQLSAERERYDELKSKYDALVMDNATLEYNAAEAEKHLPDVIKQFVDQERERAAKLVGALKSTILIFNKLGYPKTAEFVKQTIAEYDTQTKS